MITFVTKIVYWYSVNINNMVVRPLKEINWIKKKSDSNIFGCQSFNQISNKNKQTESIKNKFMKIKHLINQFLEKLVWYMTIWGCILILEILMASTRKCFFSDQRENLSFRKKNVFYLISNRTHYDLLSWFN